MNRILYFHGFASGPSSGKARFLDAFFRSRGAALEIPALDGGDFENLTIGGQLALIGRLADGAKVSLMGSSMGGYLAALYAAAHPEVERLVLLAPAFGFARRWAAALGPERVTRWRADGAMEVFHYGEGRPRQLGRRLLEEATHYPEQPEVRQPTLIFHGRHDDVVPASASAEFAAGRPNVQLEIVDSGHDLHNVLEWMAPRAARFLLDRGPEGRECYPEH